MNLERLEDRIIEILKQKPLEVEDLEKSVGYPKILVQQAIFELARRKKIRIDPESRYVRIVK